MICYCSLAGTAACKNCMNNINSDMRFSRTYLPTVTFTDEVKHSFSYNVSSDDKEKSNKPSIQYLCSECDALIDKRDKYCSNCGSKIDWSDFED